MSSETFPTLKGGVLSVYICCKYIKYIIFVCFQEVEPIEDDIFVSFKNPAYTVSSQ